MIIALKCTHQYMNSQIMLTLYMSYIKVYLLMLITYIEHVVVMISYYSILIPLDRL